MQVLFQTVRELFEDMHEHVRRTGDSVICADIPGVFPPLLGWTSVGYDKDGTMIDPVENRHWTISLGNFSRTRDNFFPENVRKLISKHMADTSGRRTVAVFILEMFCWKCGTMVAGNHHSDEECCVTEVMSS